MPVLCHPRNNELRGDYLQRAARRGLLLAIAAILISLPLYFWLGPLWHKLAQLGGIALLLSSAVLGLALAAGPICALGCLLCACFYRIESNFQPRTKPASIIDRLAIALGLLVSFAPALAACYPPIQALQTGSIRYKMPAEMVSKLVDPLGYWQGIGFWFMGAAALAFVASLYWRNRWKLPRRA